MRTLALFIVIFSHFHFYSVFAHAANQDRFWVKANAFNLDQMLQISKTPQQKAAVYLLMALVLPKGDYHMQKSFLTLAVQSDPQNTKIRYYSEFFSLSLAEAVLNTYEKALNKAGIYRPLGMMHFEKYGVNPTTIFHEFMENTIHSLVYAFTSYPDYLQGQYSLQLKRLWESRSVLSSLRSVMMSSSEPVEIRTLLTYPDRYEALRPMKTSIREFKQTVFMKEILEKGIFSNLPMLQELGVPIEVDFLNLSVGTIAVDLINLWNAAWLIGLPIGVHKLLHLAEDSRYFAEAAHSLEHFAHHSGIAQVADRLRALPLGVGIIPAFIVVESADGCLIGIAKMARDAYIEARSIDELQLRLNQDLTP